MPGKMVQSAPRPPFGLPKMPVAIHTSRQCCREAGKARILTPVWESSGESRLMMRVSGAINRASNYSIHRSIIFAD
jgi:hypothetical protein